MEKLLPIEPGCIALIMKGESMGRSAKVLACHGQKAELFTDGGYLEVESMDGTPLWELEGRFSVTFESGNSVNNPFFNESVLMRIDGHKLDENDLMQKEDIENFCNMMSLMGGGK